MLIYSLNYEPELTGIGKYSGEMARWLARAGCDVRVVTGFPYYPEWVVKEGFRSKWFRRELCDGVDVIRCPLWVPSKPGGLKRILHLGSFALSSLFGLLASIKWRPDVVWVVVPAYFCAPGALALARVSKAKAWIHIQDFEVDAAFELGILKGVRTRRAVLRIERSLLRCFDRVSTISGQMMKLALKKGVASERTYLFRNWVGLVSRSQIDSTSLGSAYRDELGIPSNAVVALYSGNMGAKQGLEVLVETAKLLESREDIYFVFCGNGAGREALERPSKYLKNVRIIDLQPLERLTELLSFADVHLLPQRADAADLVMPSKLTGMLASARPIVATAAEGTEVASVVTGAGVVVPPGSAINMARALEELADDPELRKRLGQAGREYAEMCLDADKVLKDFLDNVQALVRA